MQPPQPTRLKALLVEGGHWSLQLLYSGYSCSTQLLVIIALAVSIVLTLIYYPGVLYSDSYLRWSWADNLLHFSGGFAIQTTVYPSVWMAALYAITNNFASYTLFQSFLFFLATYLLLQEFLLLRGPALIAAMTAITLFPLMQGYSVFHETSIGTIIGMNLLLLLLSSRAIHTGNWQFLLWLFGLFLGATFLFGFRQNSVTVLPAILVVAVRNLGNSRKYLVASIAAILLGGTLVSLLPTVLNVQKRDTLAVGLAWEMVQTLKRVDNLHGDEYLAYLGDFRKVHQDVYNSMWGSYNRAISHENVLLPEYGRRVRADFVRLLEQYPSAFLRNKIYVISRVLGVKKPLEFTEFKENRWNMLQQFGYRYTDLRHNQFLMIGSIMKNDGWLSRPIIHFAVVALILALSYKRLPDQFWRPLLYLALVSALYYGAFFVTTQGYEFRYYFPSFYLNFVIVLSACILGLQFVTASLLRVLMPGELTQSR